MNKFTTFLFSVLVTIHLAGCAAMMGPKPLTLSPYRRNIILRADASVLVEDELVDFRVFHKELIKRAFSDKDRVVLHAHQDVDPKVFGAVYDKLIDLGYKNVSPVVYK